MFKQYLWVIYGVVLCFIFIFGYRYGSSSVKSDWDEERAEQAITQAKRSSEVANLIKSQSEENELKVKDYETKLANIRIKYKRLRDNATYITVPSVPNAPEYIDEIPADALPLAGQCAETTQQLKSLQEWVLGQQALMDEDSKINP